MKGEYRTLKRKILLHILAIVLIGLALWGCVQFFLVDRTLYLPASTEISLTEDGGLVLTPAQTRAFVDTLEARQSALLLVIGILAILLVALYYVITQISRYFREASKGVGKLLDADVGQIALPPEMGAMQTQLNDVKDELVRREQEARDAERRKNELVVYLAHDIRTPLTTVIGYLNLMAEQPTLPTAQRAQYLALTLESAKRLDALINQFFEITRYNAQEMQLALRPFDLAILLGQLAESFYPELAPHGKRILLELPPHLDIVGDADKLARVFRNLLKNAAVYSDADTAIQVKAAAHNGAVAVTVSDTGSPIPPEELDSIFDKFYRLDSARGAKTGGAGLGLAIAREIVLAHGGTITAASTGNETIFTVTLPCAGEAASLARAAR